MDLLHHWMHFLGLPTGAVATLATLGFLLVVGGLIIRSVARKIVGLVMSVVGLILTLPTGVVPGILAVVDRLR